MSQLRQQAATLIKKHGWVQDWEGDCDHGYCLSGALHEAASQHESSGPEHDHAVWEIGWEAAKRGDVPPPVTIFGAMSLIVNYNDSPGRTMNEILEILK